MEFNGVFHQAYDNYCYPINEDELIINIKTGYDVKEVNIILGDPFAAGILGGGENWNGDKQPVIFKKKLKNQIWWTTTVKPPYKRLKYYFELITEDVVPWRNKGKVKNEECFGGDFAGKPMYKLWNGNCNGGKLRP